MTAEEDNKAKMCYFGKKTRLSKFISDEFFRNYLNFYNG